MNKTIVKYDTKNARSELLSMLGNIDGIEVFNNQVLVVTYIRPED